MLSTRIPGLEVPPCTELGPPFTRLPHREAGKHRALQGEGTQRLWPEDTQAAVIHCLDSALFVHREGERGS